MESSEGALGRVQKLIEALKTKNCKLAEENARLKQQIADLKASNSRIRRIPKKASAAAATGTEEAVPVQA